MQIIDCPSIAKLSIDRDAQAEIIQSGAMLPLIEMLKTETHRTVAAEALKCLMWHGHDFSLF